MYVCSSNREHTYMHAAAAANTNGRKCTREAIFSKSKSKAVTRTQNGANRDYGSKWASPSPPRRLHVPQHWQQHSKSCSKTSQQLQSTWAADNYQHMKSWRLSFFTHSNAAARWPPQRSVPLQNTVLLEHVQQVCTCS